MQSLREEWTLIRFLHRRRVLIAKYTRKSVISTSNAASRLCGSPAQQPQSQLQSLRENLTLIRSLHRRRLLIAKYTWKSVISTSSAASRLCGSPAQ